MKTAIDIISEMASAQYVERKVKEYLGVSRLRDSLQDLSQMVYEALLNTDAERIVKLWEGEMVDGHRQMDFYIITILRNQTRGDHPSHWGGLFTKWDKTHIDITSSPKFNLIEDL